MSPRLRTALALAGSFALGGGLLYVALRGADFGAVWAALRDGAWGWLVPLTIATVLSVALRAWRWTLLLNTLPQTDGARQTTRTPFGVAFVSVLIGYLVNLAVPRLGEVVRAGNLAARRPVGFAAVVGTVVAERLLDVAMLALSLVTVTLVFGDRLGAVAAEAARGLERLVEGLPALVDVLIVAGIVALIVAVFAVRARRRRVQGATPSKGAGLLAQFRDGALTLVRTGRPLALTVSTLGIWACYAVMSELPLRILGMTATYGLNVVDAFALMTFGAVGMALPSPGGAGSYHYATVQTLVLLFGVPTSPAATYAVLGHAAQLLFYAVAGLLALVWQGTGIKAVTQAAHDVAEEDTDEPTPVPPTPRPAAPRPVVQEP